MNRLFIRVSAQAKRLVDYLLSPFRMRGMTYATLGLLVVIYFLAKQQIGVLAFKACLMTGAAAIGYAIDRTLFPASRPQALDDPEYRWRSEWRRAIIVAAALLTAGLGS